MTRSDFTDATVAATVHPQHHNDLAIGLDNLTPRVAALETAVAAGPPYDPFLLIGV